MKDEELERWMAEWHALGGRDGLAKELATCAARDAWRIRRDAVGEVAACLFSSAFGVWLVVRTQGRIVAVAAVAGVLLFNGAWLTRLFTLREAESRDVGGGIEAFVEVTRRRLIDDMRWSRFARKAMMVVGGLIVPWAVWAYLSQRAAYDAAPWRALVGFGGALAIVAAVFAWNERRRKVIAAERARFEGLVAERTLPLGAPENASC